MINKLLSDFLQNLQNLKNTKKEEKDCLIYFIIPAGAIRGKFKNYDDGNDVVTLSYSSFSSILLEVEMSIPTEIIQAWGKK